MKLKLGDSLPAAGRFVPLCLGVFVAKKEVIKLFLF